MRISKHIASLKGYVHGDQPRGKGIVKINTNENAYPPSPKCAEVLKAFSTASLRIYPDAECTPLREAAAELHSTSPERIFVGNGSDEILSLAAKAFVENDESIASLDPSYSLYKTIADIRDVAWKGHAEQGRRAITPDGGTSLFLWTNPNAPTGTFTDPSVIKKFADGFPGVVIIDEAYADFAPGNCMHLATAADNRNIIVMRTFSKSYSLAGLRVGYAVGPEDLIGAMMKIKDSYNVDAIAQCVALAALRDRAWMLRNVKRIIRTREWFSKELADRGWNLTDSAANFVFARPPKPATAAGVFEFLKDNSIFTRHFKTPATRSRIRFTIGTDAEMKKTLSAIDKYTAQ